VGKRRTERPANSDDVTGPLDVRLGVLELETASGQDNRRALGRRLAKLERVVVADLSRVDTANDGAELRRGQRNVESITERRFSKT
jgi:hypothetical protein